jgi:hypothetical protein
MTAQMLVDALFTRVFSWVGLPSKIVGDRDSRPTASQMRALVEGLSVKLNLSVAYHPQTDGQTEQFNSTLLQCCAALLISIMVIGQIVFLHCFMLIITLYMLPPGYTPHRLLFGRCPRDLRAQLTSEF